MRILISGIGRSGTTTIFQIVGKALLAHNPSARCVYEPYLWNIPEVESTAEVKGQPFSVNQIGLFNVLTHCNTPLFLDGRHRLHDQWLRKIYGPPKVKYYPPTLAKVIRGSGRLISILSYYPDLRVVLVMRNVVDTVNSGLGLFSFYGDEFHPSDKDRFIEEVNQKFGKNYRIEDIKGEKDWAVLWWRYMSQASLDAFKAFPDRVKLVPYEEYVRNKLRYMEEIMSFVGLPRDVLDDSLLDRGAGPITNTSYLTEIDISSMQREIRWYCHKLREHAQVNLNEKRFLESLIAKYSKRKYQKSLLLTCRTDLTGVQWRIKLRDLYGNVGREDKFRLEQMSSEPFDVISKVAQFGGNRKILDRLRITGRANSPGMTIGVLITCFNNELSIANAIYSVLAQTRRPDLIVVADDCSTDNSVAAIEAVAAKYPEVKLVKRGANVGVAANRDLAIRDMNVDLIATLDGDDLYFPEKIELESLALLEQDADVAFSDIVVVQAGQSMRQDTSRYDRVGKSEMLEMMTSRIAPVPRDMLFRKSVYLAAGGFDIGMTVYEDWALKMRLVLCSRERGWVHSAGIGTIYDRRTPGLSGVKNVMHAYGQLLAISRNINMLRDYPKAVKGGILTASKHLSGTMRRRLEELARAVDSKDQREGVFNALYALWHERSFFETEKEIYERIWRLSGVGRSGKRDFSPTPSVGEGGRGSSSVPVHCARPSLEKEEVM